MIFNTALFIVFPVSSYHPRTKRDWRAMGAYSAFLIALFTETYGIPLTIYLLGSWLGTQFPLLRNSHIGSHRWNGLIGWSGDPRLSPFHLASYVAIGAGFWLIAADFPVLVYVYVRLAHDEEREVTRRFGDRWTAYAARTPAFWPHLIRHRTTAPPVAPPATGHPPGDPGKVRVKNQPLRRGAASSPS
ncbi:methyltransferase family protein [Streptomyces asiaticus]